METCYHTPCDDMQAVDDDDLEFLKRTVNAVIQATLELSEAGKFIRCEGKTNAIYRFMFYEIDSLDILLEVVNSSLSCDVRLWRMYEK